MGYFKAHGLRGSSLEELINRTNAEYLTDGLAVVQKIPTPIKPTEIDSERHVITLAYFDEKSTVDYIGNVQGIPICFDAKETKGKSLSISNIHEHQVDFMQKFAAQDAIAFLLVYFTDYDRFFAMDISTLSQYYEASKSGGKKSIAFEEFEKCVTIERYGRYLVHYLPAIQVLIDNKKVK